jgi:hypothetical protein
VCLHNFEALFELAVSICMHVTAGELLNGLSWTIFFGNFTKGNNSLTSAVLLKIVKNS